jgi:uncharacterized protein (TIGR03437 family)
MRSLFIRRLPSLIPLTVLLAFFFGSLTSQNFEQLREGEFEPEVEAEDGRREKPEAEEWFYEQRAYPLKSIPPGARVQALAQLEAVEARRTQARVKLYGKQMAAVIEQQSQPRWEALGPQPIINGNTGTPQRPVSGRATAIALDPGYDGVNNRTLYLGTAQGGVWKSTDDGANWRPITDDQPSLAIGSIAVDPFNPNVIYVGTGEGNQSSDSYYGAGLLKSVDSGNTWRLIEGPLSSVNPRQPVFRYAAIMRIVIDPRNTQTLYLVTRSAATYGAAGGTGTAAVTPGQRGVWKSTDGGETWRNLDPAGNNGTLNASALVLSPQDSNVVLAGVPARGVYRSKTGGEPGTWELLTGLPTSNAARIEMTTGPPLASAPNQPTFFAAVANGSDSLHGLYRSTNNGDTWTRLNNLPSIGQTFYNFSLAIDSQNADIIHFGLVSLYRSVDGGQSWASQMSGNNNDNGGIHVDQHFALVHPTKPNLLFVANDGGIWRAENANNTPGNIGWFNLNQTLNTVQFQGLALHPTNPNLVIGGTQDNGTNRYSGELGWTRIAGGDGGPAVIDQSNPQVVYHTFNNSSSSGGSNAQIGPEVSLNGGNSWTRRGCFGCSAQMGNFNPSDRVGFYAPIAQHTGFTGANGNVIYFGTHRLYRTANLGQMWTGLGASGDGFGQDLTRGGTARLSAIAAHPKLDTTSDPPGEIVWTGASDGTVQVTTNAGKLAEATFTNVTKAPLPNRFVTDIAVDPNETRRAYVVFSGFNAGTPTTPGHVFVTDDLGQTWRDISGDLPDVPVTALAPDPTQAGTLYLGTDIGVFQTTDGGGTWVRLGNGMPRVATFMVRYHAASRSLVVATHGRGMYRLKLAAPVVTVSSANFKRESLAVEGIASAFGQNLATRTEAARSLPLPTELAGTTVRLTDANGLERLAPLFFVSAQQINYQIPLDIAPGAVTVTITNSAGTVSFGIERVRNFAPSLFTANANGGGVPAGYAVRVSGGVQTNITIARLDSSTNPPQYMPEAIDLGAAGDQVVLVIFGTGLRRRPDLSGVDVTIGGVRVPADYAGETPGLVGLDQLNFVIPRNLAGRGEVDVAINASGLAANVVRVSIK